MGLQVLGKSWAGVKLTPTLESCADQTAVQNVNCASQQNHHMGGTGVSWEWAVQFMPGRALSAGIKDVPELGGLTVQ